jgi:hypothetical protein
VQSRISIGREFDVESVRQQTMQLDHIPRELFEPKWAIGVRHLRIHIIILPGAANTTRKRRLDLGLNFTKAFPGSVYISYVDKATAEDKLRHALIWKKTGHIGRHNSPKCALRAELEQVKLDSQQIRDGEVCNLVSSRRQVESHKHKVTRVDDPPTSRCCRTSAACLA